MATTVGRLISSNESKTSEPCFIQGINSSSGFLNISKNSVISAPTMKEDLPEVTSTPLASLQLLIASTTAIYSLNVA